MAHQPFHLPAREGLVPAGAFAVDSAELTAQADNALKGVAETIGGYDGGELTITGHTDDVATAAGQAATVTVISTATTTVTREVTTTAEAPAPASAGLAAADSSAGQSNAARSARQYLDISGFSRSGLIEQLQYEGYSPEQATYGATAAGL